MEKIYHTSKLNYLRWRSVLPFLVLYALFSPFLLQAEGIRQVAPSSTDKVMLLISDPNYGNFATADSPASSRLNIQFKDAGEILYLGLSREYTESGNPAGTGSYSFQIRRASDNAVVHGPFNMNSFVENLSSWEDASGPAVLNGGVGYPTDDNRFQFVPTAPGLYYIEFINAFHIGLWDFTVANNGAAIPGRVFSKNWAFRTPVEDNNQPECVWDHEFNGALYSYTNDGFVTRINFANSGFQGLSFTMAFNTRSLGQTGDIGLDRMSVPNENVTADLAEHLVFLSEPDPSLFPDGTCGEVTVAPYLACTGVGTYCLDVAVTQPGQVELIIDFNQNGRYDADIDRRILYRFNEGEPLQTCLNWDGLLGDGTPITAGAFLRLIVLYNQGIQHWALFDGEFLKNGFCVAPVRPLCGSGQLTDVLYWDDRNIIEDPGTGQPKDGRSGCTCSVAGCRTWNNFNPNTPDCNQIDDNVTTGYGDKATLNTWWFANVVRETYTNVPLIDLTINGATELCDDESATLDFGFTSSAGIASLTWEGPGGIIASGPTAPLSIEVDAPGTYTFTLVDANGCSFTATHLIGTVDCPTDLELDIAASDSNPALGSTVTFTITVFNAGDFAAANFAVTANIPGGVSNIQAITGGGVPSGNVLVWDNLDLPVGATLTFTFTGVVVPVFDYTIAAEVSALPQGDIDSTPGNGVDTNGNGQCADDAGDEDDGDCVELFPPACTITAAISNVVCNANGTFSDPTDDTYTFSLSVTGSNGSTGWSGLVGSQPVSGNYGAIADFGPFLISEGNLNISVEDAFYTNNCIAEAVVVAPPPCSNQCILAVEAGAGDCNDGGTPAQGADDTFAFTFRISGTNTSSGWLASDGSTGDYNTWYTYTGYAIAAGDVVLTYTDQDELTCQASYTFVAPAPCSTACVLEAVVGNAICSNAGTPSDPTDDTFSFTINVSGLNTSGATWVANDPNNFSGSYNTNMVLGPYPVSGGDLSFTISDAGNPACGQEVMVAASSTCSNLCALTLEEGNTECQDNGTPADDSDDTYTVLVRLSGANAGTAWTASNGQMGVYGEWVLLGPFPIGAGDAALVFTDSNDANCNLAVLFAAPSSCSTTCILTATATTPTCDDAGTPSYPTDDTFTFFLTVTGSNTSAFWVANNPAGRMGMYGQPQLMGPYPISAGDQSLTITDGLDVVCRTTLSVAAPASCSDECALAATLVNDPVCNPGTTPNDATDDTFSFVVRISGNNTATTWTASNGQVGNYNTDTEIGPFAISIGTVFIVFTDNGGENCTDLLEVDAPASCSNDCLIITTEVTNIQCNDNGTPTDPADDTFSFAVVVAGFNLGATWQTSSGAVGNYGTPVTFGPYAIADGEVVFNFNDSDQAGCSATVTVAPPTTCSDQCAIGAEVSNVQCLDNGTPVDSSDDLFTFDLLVASVNNTATGWIQPTGNAGTYGQTYTQGPFPISGGTFDFVVQDGNQPNCTASITVAPPAAGCSNSCLLVATVLSVDCQDEGTPEDGTDDTFVYTLRVDAVNATGTWVASDGTSGNYGQTVESVVHNYAEGNLTLTVTDGEGLCSTTFSVNPPLPALLCPPDTDQRAFRGSVQILRGELNEQDVVLPEAPCFLALTSTPMSIGDRFMQGVDVLTPEDADTLENVYNFFLFSEIALPADLASVGSADGAGMLFRGDYTGYADPCCFSMNYPPSLGDNAGLTIENPYVDTTGMFAQDMVLVQKFTHSLKMGQPFSLVTTTYGAGTTGKFAWVIVTEEEDSLAVLSTGITSEFRPNQDLRSDLTHLNLFWTQDNPASLAFLGEAIVEPYCGVDSLFFGDQLDFSDDCDEAYINRTFFLEYGNQIDSCEQQITFRRPEYDDIVLPPATVTLQCGDDYELDSEGYPHPNDTGYPLLDIGSEYIAMDRNTPFFNLQSSYKNFPDTTNSDMVLDFTREWTITDVCNGDTLYIIPQRIKIGDFFPPTMSCPLSNHYCPIIEEDIMLFATDPFSCTATVVVPLPELRGFCDESRADEWTITTEIIRVADGVIVETLAQDDSRSVSNLERGDYFLHYLAEDGTGQRVAQTCRMRVADLQVPTAICRNRLTISLDADTPSVILPGQLDLGSNDNCDTPEFRLRRYHEAGTSDCAGGVTGFGSWQESIGFSCCDVGQTFLVELRVMDADSNLNGCNTLIDIVDNVAPVLSGLTSLALPCSALPANFDPADSLQLVALFGQPTATDYCQVSVVELTPELSWNNCELGSIRRKFVATDTHGNTTGEPYEQLITVNSNDSYGIRLPKDQTTDCLDGLEELQFMAPGCGNFTVQYEDVDLDPAGAGCLRIQRTYHIVNTCTYDGVSAPVVISRNENCAVAAGAAYTWLVVDNGAAFTDADSLATNQQPPVAANCNNPAGYWRTLPNVGAWEYTQIIEINDNTPPSLQYSAPTPVCTVDNSCEAPVNLTVTIGGECLSGRTKTRLFLDANNDGTTDEDLSETEILGGGWPNFQINGRFPIGNHAFIFEAEDACGNIASARIPFVVADCFIGQPICDIGLEVQLVPVVPAIDVDGDGILDEAAIVLSAALLAEMSGLDCSGIYRYSVNEPGQTPNFGNISLILTCEDRYTATREIVVRDQAYNPLALQPDGSMGGPNYRRCTLQISLQDSMQVCTSCAVSELEIEGVIRDRRLQPVSEVMVELLVNDVLDEQTFTILDGKFEFPHLAFSTNYEVRPYKNDDTHNGITGLDLILLQRHLLLQTVITDPYTLLAADINRDGNVTTLDLLFMQALLLDRINVFPNNTSWRFVPSSYPLTDIAADIPDSYRYFNLINCQFAQDFIGVKIGDLNGSASANGSLTGHESGGRAPWPLLLDDQGLREGASYQIPVRASDLAQWSGVELTLAFEQQQLEVLEIEPGLLTAGDLNTAFLNRGILKAVWAAGAIAVDARQKPLFTLVVRAKTNNQLSKVLHLSEQAVSWAYDQELTPHELVLEFRTGTARLLLLANKPDPFHTETYVDFYLPQAGEYLLEVNDINGKVLQRVQAVAPAGAQQVVVDGSQLPAGVLFYKLTFAGQSITRRMVKL